MPLISSLKNWIIEMALDCPCWLCRGVLLIHVTAYESETNFDQAACSPVLHIYTNC